jgi:hypothetical protein
MNQLELLNALEAAARTLDDAEGTIRTTLPRLRDRIQDRIVELTDAEGVRTADARRPP